jgi:hypothetical protein
MKYTDLCEHLERMARRDRDGATQAIPRLAKRLHEANAERLEQAAAAIRELEAERDVSNEIGRAFEEDAGQQRERAEAAEAKALKDAKAHEKEIAVWSENYAALERKVQELVEAERERCAQIAINMNNGETAKAIAAAIRKGGP